MSPTEFVGLFANAVTIFGIGFVIWQMKRDRSYASASAVMAICTNIRLTLEQIGKEGTEPERFEYLFRNLLNEIELASAIVLDGGVSGRTGEVARLFLLDVLVAIQSDRALADRARLARETKATFKNLLDFIRLNKRQLNHLANIADV